MPHPILYAEDHYVVLRPHQGEEFLTAAEMLALLQRLVQDHSADLPLEIQTQAQQQGDMAAAQALLDSTCELSFSGGDWVQWYAVRLEA